MGNLRKTIVLLLAVISLAAYVWPEASFAQVQFKSVKPPKPGARKRINIQVTTPWPPPLPKAGAAPKVEASAPAAPKVQESSGANEQAWFWDVISPQLDAADPERVETSLLHLNNNPKRQAALGISEKRIRKVAAKHGLDILKATLGRSISPALVLAVIEVESGGVVDAKSNKGAQGLMQLIPATAERFGVKDTGEPLQNITGGTKYLDWLLKRFRGDALHALAGYNAGENAVLKAGGVPAYAETRRYVPKVIAAWGIARQLCITPPRQVRDGCVFKTDLVAKK